MAFKLNFNSKEIDMAKDEASKAFENFGKKLSAEKVANELALEKAKTEAADARTAVKQELETKVSTVETKAADARTAVKQELETKVSTVETEAADARAADKQANEVALKAAQDAQAEVDARQDADTQEMGQNIVEYVETQVAGTFKYLTAKLGSIVTNQLSAGNKSSDVVAITTGEDTDTHADLPLVVDSSFAEQSPVDMH